MRALLGILVALSVIAVALQIEMRVCLGNRSLARAPLCRGPVALAAWLEEWCSRWLDGPM